MKMRVYAAAALSMIGGSVAAAPALQNPRAIGASSAPMSADQLADVSGGQAIVVNALSNQTLNATVTGNQITAGSVQSGAVTFANGALSGFNGIGNFVINTGNNNVLQGSLSVTVVPLP